MKPNLSKAILKWCQLHDWGTTAELKNGSIYLYEDEYRNKLDKPIRFDDWKKLQAWAGY